MKTKFCIFTITLLFVISNSVAQNIETYFGQQQTVSFQKLYLHTDREFYFSGDTLWFAAYLVDGKSHIPGSEGFTLNETLTKIKSCNLYVELFNANGELIKSELFLIQNGLGSGYVSLSDSAGLEGNFMLRAYTDNLKNFGGDAFFTKPIRISTVKNSFELHNSDGFSQSETLNHQDSIHQLNLKSAGELKEIDISFLPEGGFLLAGESNCVAFKAVDQSGKGRDISGKLLDEKENIILTFKSVYKGAGKFYFYPKTGKSYTAKIDSFPNLYFELPEIKNTGAKLTLINQDENKIQMVVQGKNSGRNQLFYLVCLHRGEGLFYKQINQKKINSVLKIDAGQLRVGVNRFVLLDNNLNPVSERMVFKEANQPENIEISLNGESFSTREEVQLKLKADNLAENELANVSISVVDENYINATGISQNIASYLLLDSELNGHIESPANYFVSDENISAKTKLDLLMCTNGWNNYVWNNLNNDSIKVEFEPQTGFNFTGQVKRALGNKALTEGNVSMILFHRDSTVSFFDQPLDINGDFEFQNIVFYDSASVVAQARNKNDKHNLQIEMTIPKIFSPEVTENQISLTQNIYELPFLLYRQRYLNEMRLKEFYPDKKHILIEEVEVKAWKHVDEIKTGMPRKDDGPYYLTWEETAGASDIIQYLAFNVPGVHARYNSEGLYIILSPFLGPAAIIIDGFQFITQEEAKGYNISVFERIEIITPPMSNIYGSRALSGAVLLTFRSGRKRDPESIPFLGGLVEKIKGFTPICEFYSPKYLPENLNSEVPDFRNTLYWNPKVIFENGEHELFFFASDNISRYKIYVEGITESGKICLGEAKIEVDRFLRSKK